MRGAKHDAQNISNFVISKYQGQVFPRCAADRECGIYQTVFSLYPQQVKEASVSGRNMGLW